MIHSDFSGGENLAGNTNHDVSQMFNQWMNEKAAFDESGYRAKFLDVSYNGKVVGHYSQIVWAKNSKLGCGLSYCEKLSYKNLLVCRYETGNYLNQQVYEESNITTIDSTSLNSPEENDNSSGYNIIFNHRFYYHLFIVIILAVLF
ncbi:hypothetical protein BCR36DRAFT_581109 [Piromyces finnis]|uniref:SCP domain-containing protein n=1 Tax=Piromyces finnis TaxID=1754191 RepID=A0A1Y1VGU6_9FUNG|nr:hypothetical protein BCR36DRAFT_581109 [Piromyces finnis]|eukprot:ORX55948.1 hypothetical protein BCR36DRAFT_581109 [Piromyces finnis]